MYDLEENVPQIIDVPCATYIMIRGRGAWNDSNGRFAEASRIVRNIHKEIAAADESFDQSLRRTPLECFWWQQGVLELDLDDKESFIWAVSMQVGDISNSTFAEARKKISEKLGIDCAHVFMSTVVEGSCAQIRHKGGYEHEKETVALLKDFVTREGYKINRYSFSPLHEIYIPLKEAGKWGQWDTVYRWPVSRIAQN